MQICHSLLGSLHVFLALVPISATSRRPVFSLVSSVMVWFHLPRSLEYDDVTLPQHVLYTPQKAVQHEFVMQPPVTCNSVMAPQPPSHQQ